MFKGPGTCVKALSPIVGFLMLLTVSACAGQGSSVSSSQSPRAVTNEESYFLASVLFNNYNRGIRQIRASFVDGPEQVNTVGWVEFSKGFGYVKAIPVSTVDAPVEAPFLIRWDRKVAEIQQGQQLASDSEPPLPEPVADWEPLPLNPDDSFLGQGLAAILLMAKDRPENPQLLQQSSAQWLRQDNIDGVLVNVFSGPGSGAVNTAEGTSPSSSEVVNPSATSQDSSGVRYWIDGEGILRRVEIRLGKYGDFSRIDFADPSGNVEITGPAT